MNAATVFIIALTTSRIVFPGVPIVSPGSDDSVSAVRSLSMDLYSSNKADHLSKAEVNVPDGLKLTNPVPLVVDLRRTDEPSNRDEAGSRFAVKTYWGSTEKVPVGQPRVSMSDEPTKVPQLEKLPDTSHAYWSTDFGKPLEANVSARGTYKLVTNFSGSISVTLDSDQDFLDPIELVGVHKKADLTKPVRISWRPVPRALGYLVSATGGTSGESINWTSSADPDVLTGIEERSLTRSEIANLIENRVLLPPDVVTCTIPAGVFKGSKSVFVNVIAFGPDKVQITDGIQTRIIIRSTTGIPIFGTSYKPIVEEEEKASSSASNP
ncbi:MAG: hypothetical protein N3B12_04065 [Armatimonadetes bacterium]|nr:hypothetical protein [Armatimonadota bacterium]